MNYGHLLLFLCLILFCCCKKEEDSIPAECIFENQESYSGNCLARPPGTVCLVFSDGYIWLINDGKSSEFQIECQNNTVEIIIGQGNEFHHVLYSNLVRTVMIGNECDCQGL